MIQHLKSMPVFFLHAQPTSSWFQLRNTHILVQIVPRAIAHSSAAHFSFFAKKFQIRVHVFHLSAGALDLETKHTSMQTPPQIVCARIQ